MKKSLLFAALAVVAMASCTKNELKVPSTGSDAVISFQPVVANATKATYLTTTNMATACNQFGVFAWYPEGGGEMQASTTNGTLYMNNVTVTYNGSFNDNDDQGSGTWAPSPTYYWPKNGKLSFDAYAPASAHADKNPGAGQGTFTSIITKGLQIANYTVAELGSQYDLLYSTRALNKNTSNGGKPGDVSYDENGTYDGVDIAFKHALSAIEVTAKTFADYSGAIKLKKITILNAYNKGDFSQGMTKATTEGTAEWTPDVNSAEVSYELFSGDQELDTDPDTPEIKNAILLPQSFNHTESSKKVSIRVDYTIKHGKEELDQYYIVDLSTTSGHEGTDPSSTLTAWQIGKKYTYNFIITLDEVYFAPSVADWTDVTVDNINVQ